MDATIGCTWNSTNNVNNNRVAMVAMLRIAIDSQLWWRAGARVRGNISICSCEYKILFLPNVQHIFPVLHHVSSLKIVHWGCNQPNKVVHNVPHICFDHTKSRQSPASSGLHVNVILGWSFMVNLTASRAPVSFPLSL